MNEIPDAAAKAAEAAYRETLAELRLSEGGGFNVSSQQRRAIRAALESAAPHMLANAWQSAYDYGVDDERTSRSNPGIAGCFCNSASCRCLVPPARVNPYRG